MNKLNLKLRGKDGNAFALLAHFRKEAKRKDWTREEIDKVTEEATAGDYNHLLATLMSI